MAETPPPAEQQLPPAQQLPAVRTPARESDTAFISVFQNEQSFEAAQRMATALCTSDIVPIAYQGVAKRGNCLIVLEIAQRTRQSVLTIMQNLNIIHGRPSWGASYVIGALNTCGRFSPLEFEWQGEEGKDDWGCRAACNVLRSGVRIRGSLITIGMAKAEGWYGKNGSKWKTMPEQMMQYRAGSFFAKIHAPEILNGMQTREELEDGAIEVELADQKPQADRPALPDSTASLTTTETAGKSAGKTTKKDKGLKAVTAATESSTTEAETTAVIEPAKPAPPEPPKADDKKTTAGPAEPPKQEQQELPAATNPAPGDDDVSEDPETEKPAPQAEKPRSKGTTVLKIGTGRKGSDKELVFVLECKGGFAGKAYIEKAVYGDENKPNIPRVDQDIYVEIEERDNTDRTRKVNFIIKWDAAEF